MRHRRLLLLVGVMLLVGGAALRVGAAEQNLRIREVDTRDFPRVVVTISFDDPIRIAAQDLRVMEDGRPGRILAVSPLGETGGKVDVVLAVDVSGSMRGEPLQAAVGAANRFVRGLPEGVRVGIIAFAETAEVVQPLTSDREALLQALGSLEVGGETALYDAVTAAAGMFSGDAQPNIIVLSDGGNTVGAGTLASAVRAAREAGAAVFSVGLRSPETDVQALRTIATRTGGRYAPSDAADLGGIFEGLAAELANQFQVTYQSSMSDGEFTLTVSGAGASDSILMLAPEVGAPPQAVGPARPASEFVPQPLLPGTLGLALVLILTFLGAFTVAMMVLGPTSRQRRERVLARRIQGVAGLPGSGGKEGTEDPEPRPSRVLPGPVAALGDRIAESSAWAQGLDRKLERAGLPLRAGEFLVLQVMAVVVGALLGAVIDGIVFVLSLALLGGLVPRGVVAFSARRRRNRLHAQLADVLMLLSSALRAGHSFLQALDLVAKEIGDPGSQEFGRVVAEIRLGRPVNEALDDMAERVDSDDFRWAVMAVNIQREVGGNLAEVLDTVAHTIREREMVRRQVRVLSAEGRLSAAILTALPFLIVLYIAKVNPGYLSTLFTTQLGLVMVAIASTLMLSGILWMRKMVKIDV